MVSERLVAGVGFGTYLQRSRGGFGRSRWQVSPFALANLCYM
jgi:hypothetical protein